MSVLDLGGVVGCQEPTVAHWPEYSRSLADEVIELAERAGLHLDPWQRLVLEHALGVQPDGSWAAFEVGLDVARQNGKGAVLEALELASLFIFENRLTIHSAHQFDTSLEAFRRLLMLIEDTPELDRQVHRVSRSHGEEGVELLSKRRVRFRTRTKGGGRGFSGDCLILDEAMFLPEMAHGALLPTLSARPNPQVWYTGSAVDWQMPNPDGVVFTRVRDRGHKGDDPRLAWFEWTADPEGDPDRADELATDEQAWAQANPGLGIRISAEHVANEQRSMDPRTFAVERLGIGDWPDTSGISGVLNLEAWAQLEDKQSQPQDPLCFAADIAPDRSFAAIAVAGRRDDGATHVEVVRHLRGTGWVLDELARLNEKHNPGAIVVDGVGPAASLFPLLDERRIDYLPVNAREHAQACGLIFDQVEQAAVRHLSQRELTQAIKGAAKRPLGDAWAWARKSSSTDISPLVAVTLALWGVEQNLSTVYAGRGIAVI